jgi:hypothetical protein
MVCGGGAMPNVCGTGGCTPATCLSLGLACGTTGDGCGCLLDCGTCPAGATCIGGKCVTGCGDCCPKTCLQLGFNCGMASDGCGGVVDCGVCPPGQTCGSGTPNVCGP